MCIHMCIYIYIYILSANIGFRGTDDAASANPGARSGSQSERYHIHSLCLSLLLL